MKFNFTNVSVVYLVIYAKKRPQIPEDEWALLFVYTKIS